MTPTTATLSTDAPIAHLLERYHDTHRRELPALIERAQRLSPSLGLALQAIAETLEMHQFKEEMRLFPMMEQGGSTLVHLLVADMEGEHERQQADLRQLQAMIDAHDVASHDPELRQGLDKLFDDLHEHMRLEDDELFPRFHPGR